MAQNDGTYFVFAARDV